MIDCVHHVVTVTLSRGEFLSFIILELTSFLLLATLSSFFAGSLSPKRLAPEMKIKAFTYWM